VVISLVGIVLQDQENIDRALRDSRKSTNVPAFWKNSRRELSFKSPQSKNVWTGL